MGRKKLEEENEKKEEVIEENDDVQEEKTDDIEIEIDDDLDDEDFEEKKPSNDHDEFRSKIIKMFGIVTIVLIIILVVGFLVSLATKKKYNYADVEDVMVNAATKYFNDHKSKLPKTENEIVEINSDVLISNNYMKKLDYYTGDDSCSGKVTVERYLSSYNYMPVLTCDKENYQTNKLGDEVKSSKNIVTEGFGVYNMNGEYVYRGTDVNNYVRFKGSDRLWRIVKVTANNEVVLISSRTTNNSFSWDTRYNHELDDNSGINLYKNSDVSSILNKFYENDLTSYYKEVEFISDKEKRKMIEFNSCVGLRNRKDTSRDGSSECSVTERVRVSLLPVYDFLNASLDQNCINTVNADCQNYNYLGGDYGYWLANGDSENSNKVYYVSPPGQVVRRYANSKFSLRLVIHIGGNVNVEQGIGTRKDPYIVR